MANRIGATDHGSMMSALVTAPRREVGSPSSTRQGPWNPNFAFVGLDVELVGAPRVPGWALPETVQECVSASSHPQAPIAYVRCALRADPYLSPGGNNQIRWCWQGKQAFVSTRGLRAHLRDLGGGQYAGTARLTGQDLELRGLLLGVCGAVVEAQGGAFLHATAVEIDGGAVLFIGPSGAGKSTAADLCPGRPIFAVDKAAIFPGHDGQWWAAPLPEHVAGRLHDRRHPSRRLPLRGIFRVQQSDGRFEIQPTDALRRLLYLRESVMSGDPTREEMRVDCLQSLQESVPVAVIRTVMGQELTSGIRAYLAGRQR